jgi:hypothetical protein
VGSVIKRRRLLLQCIADFASPSWSSLFKLEAIGHVEFFQSMTGGFLHAKGLQKGIIVISNPSSLLDRRDKRFHLKKNA